MRRRRPIILAWVLTSAGLVLGAGCDSGDEGCLADWQCGVGASCENTVCVARERCGDALCDEGMVCGGDACAANPYDRDYVLVLFEASASQPRTLRANVRLAGVDVLAGPLTEPVTHVRWNLSTTVRIGATDALKVVLQEPGRGFVNEEWERVPAELLITGELFLPGSGASLMLRAWPVGAVPECLGDDECTVVQHCADRQCVAGERCGERVCDAGQICGAGACVADVYDRPYTLTLVGATMNGNWDSGVNVLADPRATVLLGDELILDGVEQPNTSTATWNLSVTRTFGPTTPFRVRLADVDPNDAFNDGDDVAIDEIYPRLPYALVRDGTLTLTAPAASVTLTLSPP